MSNLPRLVLVTGAAGFIGFHLARRLLETGETVVGLDNLNGYYDPDLKRARLSELTRMPGFTFEELDLTDRPGIASLFKRYRFDQVMHLAAQPGVRYSLIDPFAYIDSNLVGFATILEGCRNAGCSHLLYASSSSVYGGNTQIPFSIEHNVDHPLNLYAATKKANELMAHAYAHLFEIPTTGLRFFTVYGPWGRPDMAVWTFVKAAFEGTPIKLFNHGQMRRDFTYIDDIVEAILRLRHHPPKARQLASDSTLAPGTSTAPWRVFNIGNNKPVELFELVRCIEEAVGRTLKTELLPMQLGDVYETYADIDALDREIGFRPSTSLREGVHLFVDWYRSHYRV